MAAIDRGVLMMMAQSFQVSSLQHEGVRKGGGGSVICSPFPRREALDCLLSFGSWLVKVILAFLQHKVLGIRGLPFRIQQKVSPSSAPVWKLV